MNIAIVGAGCSGSYFGYLAASIGINVTIFDHSHPREKPCGGAVPARNFEKFAILKELDFPKRKIERAKVVMGNRQITIDLPEPIYIVDRKSFDRAVLDKAIASGAKHIQEKIKDLIKKDNKWVVNKRLCFDILVGADGVNSLVRKRLLGAQEAKHFGFSYYAKIQDVQDEEIALFFSPSLAGYGWVFPRPTGIACGVYFIHSSQSKRAKKLFDKLVEPLIGDAKRLSTSLHPIPCVKSGQYSLSIASESWALIGDAAMLADPYIGEGIFNALLSAELLLEAVKAGDLRKYQSKVYQTVLPEISASSKMLDGLYSPTFLKLAGWLLKRSATARNFTANFLSRKISYQALKATGIKPAFIMLKEALFKPSIASDRKNGVIIR